MALQLGLRKGLTASSILRKSGIGSTHINNGSYLASNAARFKSSAAKDAGDVIGIDLGTTNSCVAIMVSSILLYLPSTINLDSFLQIRRK